MAEIKMSTWQEQSFDPGKTKWLAKHGSWIASIYGAWCNEDDLICRGHTEAEAICYVLDELQNMHTAIGTFLDQYKSFCSPPAE